MSDSDQTIGATEGTGNDEEPADEGQKVKRRRRKKRRGGGAKRVGRKKGVARPFPAASFEEALAFAREIFRLAGGQPVRRLTLFDQLGKAPESSASRMLITNANKYGLAKGGYQAEHLD